MTCYGSKLAQNLKIALLPTYRIYQQADEPMKVFGHFLPEVGSNQKKS